MTDRTAIIEDGNTMDGLRRAIVEAFAAAQRHGADLLIYTPVKDQLKHGMLVEALGEAVCKALLKGGTVTTNGGKPHIRHTTEKTFSAYGQTREVVLACWLGEKAMDALDGTKPPAIISVAWHPDHGRRWAQQWGLTGPAQDEPKGPDPVVQRALDSLTGAVNLSTGLRHPRDKKAAKDTFLILTRAGYALPGDEVHAYALGKGWQPADARELGDLANAIADGKYASERVETWRADILDHWKGKQDSTKRTE